MAGLLPHHLCWCRCHLLLRLLPVLLHPLHYLLRCCPACCPTHCWGQWWRSAVAPADNQQGSGEASKHAVDRLPGTGARHQADKSVSRMCGCRRRCPSLQAQMVLRLPPSQPPATLPTCTFSYSCRKALKPPGSASMLLKARSLLRMYSRMRFCSRQPTVCTHTPGPSGTHQACKCHLKHTCLELQLSKRMCVLC